MHWRRSRQNQAMHAYLPAWSRDEAEALLARLVALDVPARLAVHRMEGTRSYAQPGAIARLLREVPRP